MAEKRRIDYIDAASGFFILWMINLHLADWNWVTKNSQCWIPVLDKIIVPFMPWFFYKAGMLYKRQNAECLLAKIQYDSKKLLIPFLLYSLIGHLIYCIRLYFEFHSTNINEYVIDPFVSIFIRGALNGNFALWFLVSLFVVKTSFNFLINKLIHPTLLLVFYVIIFLSYNLLNEQMVLPVLPGKENTCIPIWVGNISLGGVFFSLGYMFRNLQFKKMLIVISLIFSCAYYYMPITGCDFRVGIIDISILPLWIIYVLSSIIVFNNIFKRSPYHWPLLQIVGKNAMCLYVFHWPLLTVSRLLFYTMLGIEEGWVLRELQTIFLLVVFSLIIIFNHKISQSRKCYA